MPVRPSAKSLRLLCLENLAANLELLCYGVPRGSRRLQDIIESDLFKVS